MLFNISNFAFADGPNISAEAAILIDANTGTILFEKNSDKSMYPASTTKIMTAILTLEHRIKNKFNRIEDIINVSGIGEKKFEEIKDEIRVK